MSKKNHIVESHGDIPSQYEKIKNRPSHEEINWSRPTVLNKYQTLGILDIEDLVIISNFFDLVDRVL
jgi:hypothetical protein